MYYANKNATLCKNFCALTTQAVSNYLFGNWEMNWIAYNHARDFDLYPMPEIAPLNNFGYPYAEVGGDPLNSFDPKAFGYEFKAQQRQ
ncbi:TPA: transglutaminase [Pasteurella multocida]|nr:transglutaminase [Pasteurella multocida]